MLKYYKAGPHDWSVLGSLRALCGRVGHILRRSLVGQENLRRSITEILLTVVLVPDSFGSIFFCGGRNIVEESLFKIKL